MDLLTKHLLGSGAKKVNVVGSQGKVFESDYEN